MKLFSFGLISTEEAQLYRSNNIALFNEYIDILKTMLKIS